MNCIVLAGVEEVDQTRSAPITRPSVRSMLHDDSIIGAGKDRVDEGEILRLTCICR